MLDATNSSNSSSADVLLAEQRLSEARRTSTEIAAKIGNLRTVSSRLNEELCRVDLDWERRKFCEANLDGYLSWAIGEGKMPSSKALVSLENDARIMLLVFEHVGMRLLALDAAAKLSESEELTNLSRILQLRSQDENLRAARALASVREEIGDGAAVTVENGRAQELEEQSDRLIEQAGRLRRESNEQLTKLRELTKGGH